MHDQTDPRAQLALRLPRDLLVAAESLLDERRAELRGDGWHWRAQTLTRSDILREALRIGLRELKRPKPPPHRRQTPTP